MPAHAHQRERRYPSVAACIDSDLLPLPGHIQQINAVSEQQVGGISKPDEIAITCIRGVEASEAFKQLSGGADSHAGAVL
jgi:hypothetical protein